VKSLDISGRKFGKLLVLKQIPGKNKKWICQCDCGLMKEVLQTHLVQGNTVSCGCIRKGSSNALWKGCGEISGNRFDSIKRRIRNKTLGFTISITDIWDLFLRQNRKCALSGVEIYFGKTNQDELTASLDRINSSKGYHIDNVQWVHKKINIMKNSYEQSKFIDMCRAVACPIHNTELPFITQKGLSKDKWRDIMRANKRGINIDVSESDVVQVFNNQKGRCAITNIPLLFGKYSCCEYDNVASLDRIDSRYGYTKGNIQWVHKMVNKMKGSLLQEDFISFCKNVHTHNSLT